ncbi:MAG: LytTR family transcriptional regulator [Saprospiraceae bacterium]|nr:LytTR family transcriptional regulator [Saprospiraceae bacterium]
MKRLNSKHSHHIYTILCSPEKFAHDAWLLECFYFLDFPVLGRELLRSVQYFKRKILGNPNEGLRISYKGGIHIIKYSDIQYCKGSGNYTQIFLVSGKSIFATIQLQKLRTILESAQQFERIGKSYIFNIFNIKSLDNCLVSFLGVKNETLELSELYTKRLRGILLGVPD